jgi:hypothetical protein
LLFEEQARDRKRLGRRWHEARFFLDRPGVLVGHGAWLVRRHRC